MHVRKALNSVNRENLCVITNLRLRVFTALQLPKAHYHMFQTRNFYNDLITTRQRLQLCFESQPFPTVDPQL